MEDLVMFGIAWIEWVGYLASVLILISLLMSSIVKLRWINLVGAGIFSAYGFTIGALPVGVMNLGIVVINIYYLRKIYGREEYFQMVPVDKNSQYFKYFLEFYQEDIEKYFSHNNFRVVDTTVGLYILRNLVPAGVFLATEENEHTLRIQLDFVIPEYRDFKIGNYIFEDRKEYFLNLGYDTFHSYAVNKKHEDYLEKMGFRKIDQQKNLFEKVIH